MRYLWVEDFGDDSEDQWDKQEAWQGYFCIEDNIIAVLIGGRFEIPG